MNIHEPYMHRCLELAKLGAGNVAPNPMVGAVLVHSNRIIGEGYHAKYGQAHAEVNCLASVKKEDEHLVSSSTLYVSLEPCAHFGKTPPCADLIIKNNIPEVVIGCRDPFNKVDGKGIEKLQQAAIKVTTGVLEKESKDINKRFFTFHTEQRPYIILKWAQSGNCKIANADFSRLVISNEITNRLVHKWRSEEAAIMVGTNTALYDNPTLNTRLWSGQNPVRLIVDLNLRLPPSLKIFDTQQPTIVFNTLKNEEQDNLSYCRINKEEPLIHQILKRCFELSIQSILVEGGSKLLQSFVDENLWDEARIIENQSLIILDGLPAPNLLNHRLVQTERIDSDLVHYYANSGQQHQQ